MIRNVRLDECEVTLDVESGDHPVRGNISASNVLASGDANVDREAEDAIIERINDGDVWAWANVTVRVRWRSWEGIAILGCCSFDSEENFRASGYYDDMVQEALADLNACTQEALADLNALTV